jgi:osmoprotectant transport system permease protein
MIAISGWQWALDNRSEILSRALEHVELTVIAVAVGLLISFPLAILGYRRGAALLPITWGAGLLYTIPSLALFALLVPVTGLTITTAEIGLVSYTLLILIRNIVAGLRGVPEDAKDAARGMGFSERQLLWRVEIPLSLPAIMAGIRIATVSTVGLITIAALIGRGGLGKFILDGLRRFFYFEMGLGAGLSVALALAADALLLALGRMLTPWTGGSRFPRGATPPRTSQPQVV